MNSTLKQALMPALLLGVFSLLGIALVKLINDHTKDQIVANERAALLKSLSQIVPTQLYDNDLITDTIVLDVPDLDAEKPMIIYRARKNNDPSAIVFTTIAADGYSGKIKLLIALDMQATVLGVRVIGHQETPGLGDVIEASRSDWIQVFTGKFLDSMNEKKWAVKRDGGDFDQFTGATITSRAVVKAVKNTLRYFHDKKVLLLGKNSMEK